MSESFKVKRWLTGKPKRSDETGEIKGPEAFGMALRQAEHWATDHQNKHVQILRADTTGINAGKFFLHQIVKG